MVEPAVGLSCTPGLVPIQHIEESREHFLRWAEEGSHLVFSVGEDTIWSLEIESGLLQKAFDVNDADPNTYFAPQYGIYADANPTDSRLVYAACRYDPDETDFMRRGRYQLSMVNVDGTGKRVLTNADRFVHYPALSPDGSRVAFVTRSGAAGRVTDLLYPDNAEAQESAALAVLPADEELYGDRTIGLSIFVIPKRVALFPPVWSPDGKYLAYMEYEGSSSPYDVVLYTTLSDRTTANRTRLNTKIGSTTALPTWAPDSSELAFAGLDGTSPVLYAVKPDGSGLREIWRNDRGPQAISEISWSPDGSEILLVTHWTYLVKPNGNDFRRLADLPPVYARVGPVAWSPDGSRIAIYNPDRGIITVSPDGTGLRTLMEIDPNGQPVGTAAP